MRRARRRLVTPENVDEAITRDDLVGVDHQHGEQAALLRASQPHMLAVAHDLQRPSTHSAVATWSSTDPPTPPTLRTQLRSSCEHAATAARALPDSVVEETILAHHPTGETMKLRTLLHHPGHVAAAVVTAGLLFAAGTAAGSAAGSEAPRSAVAQTHTDAPVPSAADADTFYHYLGTLSPDAHAQAIIALNPNVRGALEAIVAGEVAYANTH